MHFLEQWGSNQSIMCITKVEWGPWTNTKKPIKQEHEGKWGFLKWGYPSYHPQTNAFRVYQRTAFQVFIDLDLLTGHKKANKRLSDSPIQMVDVTCWNPKIASANPAAALISSWVVTRGDRLSEIAFTWPTVDRALLALFSIGSIIFHHSTDLCATME